MWKSCADRGVKHKWGRNYAGRTSCWQCGVVGTRTSTGIVAALCPECGGETNVAEYGVTPIKPLRCAACMINSETQHTGRSSVSLRRCN